MYSEKVMDHFENPRNVGELPDANAVGQVGNAKCGDIMKMYMKIEDDVIRMCGSKPLAAVRRLPPVPWRRSWSREKPLRRHSR